MRRAVHTFPQGDAGEKCAGAWMRREQHLAQSPRRAGRRPARGRPGTARVDPYSVQSSNGRLKGFHTFFLTFPRVNNRFTLRRNFRYSSKPIGRILFLQIRVCSSMSLDVMWMSLARSIIPGSPTASQAPLRKSIRNLSTFSKFMAAMISDCPISRQ